LKVNLQRIQLDGVLPLAPSIDTWVLHGDCVRDLSLLLLQAAGGGGD